MSFLKKATNITPPAINNTTKPVPPKPMFKPTLPKMPSLPKDNTETKEEEVITKPKTITPKMPTPVLDLDQTDLDGTPINLTEVKEVEVIEPVISKEEQIIEKVEAEKEEEVIKETPKITMPVLPKEEEIKEVVKEEEKPKRASRSRSKKTEVKQESSKEVRELYDSSVVHISIDDIDEYLLGAVTPFNENWELEKEEISNVISELKITSDMNPGQAKVLLEELAEAQFVCTTNFTKARTDYDNLVGDNGLIKAVKALNSRGTNADDRKVSGLIACMNYIKPGESKATDLLMYERLVRDKFYFYENAVKQIEFKRQLLITFNGMLNIESRL